MAQAPENSVIRIINSENGKTVGTGFLVADCLAVTCAHVVEMAGRVPGDPIVVAFYCDGSKQRAQILSDGYSPSDENDIAFINLQETPEGSEPVQLYSADHSGGHSSRCLGYPGGSEKASWSKDMINGLLKDRTPLVLQFQSNRVERGYSGAPVYDEVLKGVVGMVSWGHDRNHTVEVHAVTANTVVKQCPKKLVLGNPPEREDKKQKYHLIEWAVQVAILLQAIPAVGFMIELLRGFHGPIAYISICLFILSLLAFLGWIGFAREKRTGKIGAKPRGKKQFVKDVKYIPRYPRLYRFARVGLWFSLFISLVVGGFFYLYAQMLESKTIILVTSIDGPELENYRVTDLLIERLKEEVQGFDEVRIQTLPQSVTVNEGSLVARQLGKRYQADIVLWGWYGKTPEQVQLTLHIENLGCNCYILPDDDTKLDKKTKVSELDNFVLQENVSNQMSALALTVAATTYYDLGQFNQAVPRFIKAAELFGNSSDDLKNIAPVYFYLGTSYYYLEQYEQALQNFNQSIQIDPNLTAPYTNRGMVYHELGKYERAIEDYDQALQIDPKNTLAYNNRGSAYTELEQYDQAIKDYDQTLLLDPNYANVYYNRGNVYYYQKQYERAIQDFTQAIQINPGDAEAYANRGEAYSNLKQYERAIQDFDQSLLIDPTNTLAYNRRGNAYTHLGKYERGIQDYDQAIRIDPKNDAAYDNRGNAYDYLKQHERAIQDYDQAILINPKSALAYYNRAIAYINLGQKEKAADDFRLVLELSQDANLRMIAEQKLKNISQP